MPATAMKPFPMRTDREKRDGYMARFSRLKADRSSWISHWSDLGRHILPRAGRFFLSDRNRAGKEKYGDILDNTATRGVRVLKAGLKAGLTNPARRWFRLTTRDPDLRDSHDVRLWLDEVVERMEGIFAQSNLYRVLDQLYDDLGCFGTACMLVLQDPDSVIRCYPITLGEFCLQQDWQGRIVTLYREFESTVGEVVKEFGYEACSVNVQHSFDNRELDSAVNLLHVIEPRADQDRDQTSPLATDMPWRSVYMETASEADKILREGGFQRMRLLAPRWQVTGRDVYGISPGMEALGDIHQLQQEQFRKSQGIDYKVRPPLQVPQALKDRDDDWQPGGMRYYEPAEILPFDQSTPHGGIRNAFEVDLQLDHLLIDIQDVRHRIDRAFFVDLFLMISSVDPDKQMTATEARIRQEEKMLMLGPVLEQLNEDLLDPLIDIAFDDMLEQGLVPPPPVDLQGTRLEIEYVSFLAQAQRSVGIAGVQQFMSDVLAVAEVRTDVIDNVDFDAWVHRIAQMRGIDAEILVDESIRDQVREARARADAAREQVAMAREQAGAVKDLAQSPTGQRTALDALVDPQSGAA